MVTACIRVRMEMRCVCSVRQSSGSKEFIIGKKETDNRLKISCRQLKVTEGHRDGTVF